MHKAFLHWLVQVVRGACFCSFPIGLAISAGPGFSRLLLREHMESLEQLTEVFARA